jgi:hypothetical protein
VAIDTREGRHVASRFTRTCSAIRCSTTKGLSDTQIQLISGHERKKSLEVYQHLSLESVDKAYQDAVQSVGI